MIMASKSQLMNAAVAALKSRQWENAGRWLTEAQRLSPFDPHIFYNLGIVAHEQGRSQDAISLWKRTLGADPHYVSAMANLGALLGQMGHELEGLHYTSMAVERDPRNLGLLNNLILALMRVGDSHTALGVIEKALAIKPYNPPVVIQKLQCLYNTKRHIEAKALARSLMAAEPTRPPPEALRILLEISANLSEWDTLSTYAEQFRQAAIRPDSTFNPTMLMFAFDDPGLLFQIATRNQTGSGTAARPPRRETSGKIRLGYMSADFREHPISHMLIEVLRRHDRECFQVILVSTAPSDGSPIAQQVLAQADERVDISQSDTQIARQLLVAAQIDVLIDLSGLTQGNRYQVLQARPCPTQILWLGCPTTTGMAHYDAWLVDGIIAPPGYEAWCSEPLVRLPCCYHPISAGLQEGISSLTRERFGIPADAVLVGMLQMPNRVRPPFIDEVVRVLARHPSAHLLLRVVEESRAQVLAHLANLGLPADRVSFAPRFPERIDYLQLVRLLDLVVDSHPYGGHSTSGEAMALGVPVLTVAGDSVLTRVATSMLHELGLGDLAACSMPQFLEFLDLLLGDPQQRGEWKRRFQAASAAPAEQRQRRLVASLETTYEQLLCTAPIAP